MSINVCEDHDDAVCIWEYGRECPMCAVVKQVDDLKKQLEKSQDQTANAEDRVRELQEEMSQLDRNADE
jgi:hypothetical protein